MLFFSENTQKKSSLKQLIRDKALILIYDRIFIGTNS